MISMILSSVLQAWCLNRRIVDSNCSADLQAIQLGVGASVYLASSLQPYLPLFTSPLMLRWAQHSITSNLLSAARALCCCRGLSWGMFEICTPQIPPTCWRSYQGTGPWTTLAEPHPSPTWVSWSCSVTQCFMLVIIKSFCLILNL